MCEEHGIVHGTTEAGGLPVVEATSAHLVERARTLLQSGRGVTEVAMDIGFTSLSAFTRLFRSRYGFPPSAESKIRKIGQA